MIFLQSIINLINFKSKQLLVLNLKEKIQLKKGKTCLAENHAAIVKFNAL